MTTNDDAMREIEAALDEYAEACVQEFRSGVIADVRKAVEAKNVALALIRSKLPQPDACGVTAKTIADGYAQIDRGESIDIDKWQDELRQKVDAEHERAVEAWRQTMCQEIDALTKVANKPGKEAKFFGILFGPLKDKIDEALRLMRARPASGKDEAAGELLRAAKEAWPWVYGHPKQSDELWQAIAKAERAGIKP